ncbi:DUF3431 domain-containing protein [Spirosoma sp. SC4-14]|uniref:DUF3431 domain-containing protein n=1 Tax=Spirosoma sp. SC4-14 TaxID=3128900 RepID=UPI0030CB1BB3
MLSLELVVARYTENLNWLRNLPSEIQKTVYDKSPDGSADDNAIRLPNVGREAHTYLHHIVSRYDSLAEWTVFCQGKPFDHAYDFKKTLRSYANDPASIGGPNQATFHWLGHLIDTDDNRGERLFRPWSKNDDGRGLDLLGFHQALLHTPGPELYTFVLGAQFVIHRDAIRQQSISFYERALAVSITFPDAAHCFERSWDRVFGLVGIDPDWLAGRQMVYLKPMKHQLPEAG